MRKEDLIKFCSSLNFSVLNSDNSYLFNLMVRYELIEFIDKSITLNVNNIFEKKCVLEEALKTNNRKIIKKIMKNNSLNGLSINRGISYFIKSKDMRNFELFLKLASKTEKMPNAIKKCIFLKRFDIVEIIVDFLIKNPLNDNIKMKILHTFSSKGEIFIMKKLIAEWNFFDERSFFSCIFHENGFELFDFFKSFEEVEILAPCFALLCFYQKNMKCFKKILPFLKAESKMYSKVQKSLVSVTCEKSIKRAFPISVLRTIEREKSFSADKDLLFFCFSNNFDYFSLFLESVINDVVCLDERIISKLFNYFCYTSDESHDDREEQGIYIFEKIKDKIDYNKKIILDCNYNPYGDSPFMALVRRKLFNFALKIENYTDFFHINNDGHNFADIIFNHGFKDYSQEFSEMFERIISKTKCNFNYVVNGEKKNIFMLAIENDYIDLALKLSYKFDFNMKNSFGDNALSMLLKKVKKDNYNQYFPLLVKLIEHTTFCENTQKSFSKCVFKALLENDKNILNIISILRKFPEKNVKGIEEILKILRF